MSADTRDLGNLLVRSAVEHAIFALDAVGRIATWDEGARRLTGYERDEIIGRHFSVLHPSPEADDGTPAQQLHRAGETGRSEDEGWRVRKDGSAFWAEVVITPMRDEAGASGRLRQRGS